MPTLRPDEADAFRRRLQRSRPDLLTEGWESEAALIEHAVALAVWRSLPLSVRLAVLVEWLTVFRGLETFPHVRVSGWRDDS